jgi:calcium-dependent protein kinase
LCDVVGCGKVFEMLSGGTLWDHIERLSSEGRMTEYEIAKVASEVLKMLAQCHALGVVYRDVKPDNFLFVTEEPNAPLKALSCPKPNHHH